MFKAQKAKAKSSPLEQVTLMQMIERYMDKDQSSVGSIEGIYTVSSVVTKKERNYLESER